MTHDYKSALDGIEWKMNDGSFTNAEKLAIISSLQLAQEAEQLCKERDELASALKEYYVMYGDRSIISSVDDLLEKAGILND